MKVDKIIISWYGGLSVVKNGIEFKQFCPFGASSQENLLPCDMNCPLFSPLRKYGELYFLDICRKTLWSDQIRIDAPGFEIRTGWEEPDLDLNEDD